MQLCRVAEKRFLREPRFVIRNCFPTFFCKRDAASEDDDDDDDGGLVEINEPRSADATREGGLRRGWLRSVVPAASRRTGLFVSLSPPAPPEGGENR